jgi:hypothetical protein
MAIRNRILDTAKVMNKAGIQRFRHRQQRQHLSKGLVGQINMQPPTVKSTDSTAYI